MQGISKFIPTETKTLYINELLKVGFDTIDFGSFVSFKAIPQLRDTVDVLSNLDLSSTSSKLLTIIANTRGATDACNFEEGANMDAQNCEYATMHHDCEGNCTTDIDCTGICGGNATTDCAVVCNGDSTVDD